MKWTVSAARSFLRSFEVFRSVAGIIFTLLHDASPASTGARTGMQLRTEDRRSWMRATHAAKSYVATLSAATSIKWNQAAGSRGGLRQSGDPAMGDLGSTDRKTASGRQQKESGREERRICCHAASGWVPERRKSLAARVNDFLRERRDPRVRDLWMRRSPFTDLQRSPIAVPVSTSHTLVTASLSWSQIRPRARQFVSTWRSARVCGHVAVAAHSPSLRRGHGGYPQRHARPRSVP